MRGVYGGKRGRLAVARDDALYLVLPDAAAPQLTILRATRAGAYADYDLVWRGVGFPPTEPLVDAARLEADNVLSVFTRAARGADADGPERNVVVLDFFLDGGGA